MKRIVVAFSVLENCIKTVNINVQNYCNLLHQLTAVWLIENSKNRKRG